jgi:hypothetical protein
VNLMMRHRLSLKLLMIFFTSLFVLACTNPMAKKAAESAEAPGKTYVGVNSVIPSGGPLAGVTRIRLLGLGFSIDSKITIGTEDCTSVTFIATTEIDCTTPGPHSITEAVDVVVTNPNGMSGKSVGGYTYRPAPTISAIAPAIGKVAGGTAVALTGTGFVSGLQVVMGGTGCSSLIVVSATQATCVTSAHALGTIDVVVTNIDSQSATLANGFTYKIPPTVTSVAPIGGNITGGTAVTVTGSAFVSGATVTFGGAACAGVVFVNATTLTCTTPAHAAGAVDVTVTNPDTLSHTLTNGFTYAGPPTVTSITPALGPLAGGTTVTIGGTGFTSGITAKIDGIACGSVTFVNSTSLTCVTPGPHVQAAVGIAVTNLDTQTASMASAFTYMDPPLAPSTLIAAAASETKVSLTWADNSNNESEFRIERSTDNITFAQIAAPAANATSYTDTGLTTDQIYYYRVLAYNLAASSAYSNVANATPIGVHLEVPVEMMDSGVVANTSATTWLRTRSTLNTTDYDGTLTYRFEVICTNTSTSARVVSLVDSSGASKATVTVAASTAVPTRFENIWTPNTGADNYRVSTPAVASGVLTCFTARMKIQQVNATKTKIYIPLVSDDYNAADNDTSVNGGSVDTTTSNVYAPVTPGHYSLWTKDSSKFADLAAGTPWTFEVVTAGELTGGRVALFNRNTGIMVTGTEVNPSTLTQDLFTLSFADNAVQFTNGNSFEVRMRRASGGTTRIQHLYRAGLWVKLTNLNKADIYYRTSRAVATSSSIVIPHSRVHVDMTRFTNIVAPVVTHEAVGLEPVVGTSSFVLRSSGTSESVTTGTDLVPSLINFNSTSTTLTRTAAIVPVSGDRFVTSLTVTSGSFQLNNSFIVISISK